MIHIWERESMRMKNFIFKSSSHSGLIKIVSLLESIQKEQRANRYDNQQELKKLDICVKGLALLVSAPDDSETLGEDIVNQDSTGRN